MSLLAGYASLGSTTMYYYEQGHDQLAAGMSLSQTKIYLKCVYTISFDATIPEEKKNEGSVSSQQS